MFFYFTSKGLFLLKYLNFCPHCFGHVGKRQISAFLTSQTGKQYTRCPISQGAKADEKHEKHVS